MFGKARRAVKLYLFFRKSRNVNWRLGGIPLLWELYRAEKKL